MEEPRRVSFEQVSTLMDFVSQHVDMATCTQRNTEARYEYKEKWRQLAKILNAIKSGPKKTPHIWSRYWSDFKNKLKVKVRTMNRKREQGVPCSLMLTKLEKRALVILGPTFTSQVRRKYNYKNSKGPAEVKLETWQDVDEFFSEDHNDDSVDHLTHQDNNIQSERIFDAANNNEDSEPEINIADQTFGSSTALMDMYPKWLIDVEQKRASAELSRAKAEQHRASTYSTQADAAMMQAEALKRISEAAIIQAEALKKLSEAASVQADAVSKLVMYLEGRGHDTHQLLPI